MSVEKIEVFPIKLPLVERHTDVAKQIIESLMVAGLSLQDGDLVAVADKILAVAEDRVVDFTTIITSKKANRLADRFGLEPGFVQLVLQEAEQIYGGVPRALLTLKHGVLIANAGIDHKNVPTNHASLWSRDPNATACKLRDRLQTLTGKKLGVLLVDSHVAPLRMGTLGFALGIAGFNPVKDCRGSLDLYGNPLLITRINLADDLASMAHFAMGETDERLPVIIIRGASVNIKDRYDAGSIQISTKDDLYMRVFKVEGKC